jgi:hypothetical protein
MTTSKQQMDEAESYAAKADVPMHLLNETLVRSMLRNAFKAGQSDGLRQAVRLIKEQNG